MKKTIIISGFILLLSVGVLVFKKPTPDSSSAISEQSRPTAQVTIGGKSLSELPIESQNRPKLNPKLNQQQVSDLKWYQISKIQRKGNNDILVFNDGSQLQVTEYVEKQLPHHIQYRLDYSLEGGAPARHGY